MSSSETRARRWLSAGALLALFVGALVLFLQHNDYPYYYHPDEFGKAKQVLAGSRGLNFHHPLLLLNVASPLKKLAGKGPDASRGAQFQRATEAGRTAAAIFAAVAVVALTVAAYLLAGIVGGLGTAVAMLFHPSLFEHAHIFKEDTALVMGLSLTCLAAVLFWNVPASSKRVAFLGAATALAISGKYVGFTALAISLPVILFAPGTQRPRRLGIFFAALFVVFAIANRQMFTQLAEWRASFAHEAGMSVSGSRGLTAQDPVKHYLYWFHATVPTTAVCFLAVHALSLFATVRRRSLAEWLVFLFPVAFTALLMSSPRVSDRYFLPAAVLFNFNALVGVGIAAEWLTRALGRGRLAGQLAFTTLALFLGWRAQFAQFRNVVAQFQLDDRRELEAWTKEHLPPGSRIAQDSTVGLPDPNHHKQKGLVRDFPHEVLGEEFVADLGTIDELRARGVRYIATTPKKSLRYTGGEMLPTDAGQAEFEKRRAFYGALPRQAKLIWQRSAREIDTLHPGLELYDLGAQP